jgi:hypothetical protein
MENTVEVAVFLVIPADIFQVHVATAFNFRRHFLEVRKRIAGGRRPRLKPPLDGKAQTAHLRKNFQPGQEEPARGEQLQSDAAAEPARQERGRDNSQGCPN